jgi:hypothetical protein
VSTSPGFKAASAFSSWGGWWSRRWPRRVNTWRQPARFEGVEL